MILQNFENYYVFGKFKIIFFFGQNLWKNIFFSGKLDVMNYDDRLENIRGKFKITDALIDRKIFKQNMGFNIQFRNLLKCRD